MPKNVYDNQGNKIGQIRDAGEEAAGAVLGLYLLWKALPGLLIIGAIVALIVWIQDFGRWMSSTYLQTKVEISSWDAKFGSVQDDGIEYEDVYFAEYELVNNDDEPRSITIGFQIPVTYSSCVGGHEISVVYGGNYGGPFAQDYVTVESHQSVQGVIVTDSYYSVLAYMRDCDVRTEGTPVFKIIEVK